MPVRPSRGDGPAAPQVYTSAREEFGALKRRQSVDLHRPRPFSEIQRRKRFHDRIQRNARYESDDERGPGPVYGDDSDEGEESWRNAEGERLKDFGVDEDVDFYDEDDIPLAVLLERRKNGPLYHGSGEAFSSIAI